MAGDNQAWRDPAVPALLRQFWSEGHTTAEIGRRLGICKNAVVGKAHRLGLTPRPSPIRGGVAAAAGAPRPSRPGRPKPAVTPLPMLSPEPSNISSHSIAPIEAEPVTTSAAVIILTVKMSAAAASKSCCWPLGEPGTANFRFCGVAALASRAYCGDHARIAYRPRRRSKMSAHEKSSRQ